MSKKALHRMQRFHNDLQELFAKNDMNLLDDLCRRNVLLSNAQEKYFGDEIQLATPSCTVDADGRTGQPDIVVTHDNNHKTEIECKLTTRHSGGSIVLQTDYGTLESKGTLDYLYVVANADFNSFAVFYFEGLTTDDFRQPSPGSRGKAAMYKHRGFKKCTPLVGSYASNSQKYLEKIQAALASSPSPTQKKKLEKRLKYWTTAPENFTIELERVSHMHT
jgi:hypothetical protein